MCIRDSTNAAVGAFADAQAALEALDSAYADVDLAGPLDYVAKRIEAMGYALASDDAFLAKNKEEAVAQNDAYNPVSYTHLDVYKRQVLHTNVRVKTVQGKNKIEIEFKDEEELEKLFEELIASTS